MATELARRKLELLHRLLAERGLASDAPKPVIPRRDTTTPATLSSAQRRMWLLGQLRPDSAAYNIVVGMRLAGALHVDSLRYALQATTDRHEVLRTVYRVQRNGEPVQVVDNTLTLHLPLLDLADDSAVDELVAREGAVPFTLEIEAPTRWRLLRLAPEEHVLILIVHHIAWDDANWLILLREVAEIYAARLDNREPRLPEPALQYADFACWEPTPAPEHLTYWRERLSPTPDPLPLPTDFPRTATIGEAAGRLSRRLAAHTTPAVRELAQRYGATPFMVLYAVFTALLHRYTGSRDIVVGSPAVNREHVQLADLIGNFGNTLVLRSQINPTDTFAQLLGRIRITCLEAYAHQQLPFDTLVSELALERVLSRSVLFDVMFSVRSEVLRGFNLPGLTVTDRPVFHGATELDLAMATVLGDEGVLVEATYRSELFSELTISQMLGHFDTLLTTVLTTPEQPLSTMTFLTEVEHTELMVTRNNTRVDVDQVDIARLFANRVAAHSHQLALVAGEVELTYAQLDAASNQLAWLLVKHGAGPEQLVAIALPRCADFIVAILATVKAGAAYLPIDPAYPRERLTYLLTDAAPVLLVSSRDVAEALPPHSIRTLLLDREDTSMFSAEPLDSAVPVDCPAYVIYTSGSTGHPKGVLVTHAGIASLVTTLVDHFEVGPGNRVLQFASMSFDTSVWEWTMGLLAGATLMMVDDEHRLGAHLARYLLDHAVTHLTLPPGALATLPEDLPLPSTTTVVVAGEACPVELARDWAARVELVNSYGPTETTVDATLWRVRSDVQGVALPIGTPVHNTSVYVLGLDLQPVPHMVPGELYVAGDGLARGYLHQPALTGQRFVANPYGAPGTRMYRTGDLCRWRHDGNLEYLGRVDHQVKIRGFRVEIGEIEAALMDYPGVAQAAVIAREDVPGDSRLVGYLVPRGQIDVEQVQEHLAARLPDYALPWTLVVLEELPRTANGKLDRSKLPAPVVSGSASRPAQGPVEQQLAKLFAEVLERSEIGVEEDFFALGGHSLLATKLVNRIRTVLDAELAVRAVFEAPTVAHLAGRLDPSAARRPPLRPADRPEKLPLSPAQQRLWFLYQLEGASPTYNIPTALRLTGKLDIAALHAALGDVVARHEVLRTIFPEVDGEPSQVILFRVDVPLEVHCSTAADLDADLAAAARYPFALSHTTPLRAMLFTLAQDDHALLLVLHHIAGDGASLTPLLRDLGIAYTARLAARTPNWEPLPVQYADYAIWQRKLLDSLAPQAEFWRTALAGAPEELTLPTDHPRPVESSYAGAVVSFRIETELAVALRALGTAHAASPFMVLQAALAALLTKLSAGTDIPLGSPVAGRTDPAVEDLVGLFVNTLVLRTDTSGDPSFSELIRRVRSIDLAAYDNQDLPFERLVELINPTRSTARNPLFQVMVVHQNTSPALPALPGLVASELLVHHGMSTFDLTINLVENAEDAAIIGHLEYSTELFDHETITAFAARYVQLLSVAVRHPEWPLSELDVLTADERQRFLASWRNTATCDPIQLWDHVVGQTPDTTALSAAGQALTYRQADERANQLAHQLINNGVGPEDIIALALGRSADSVIAILATLKAGAAYLPIDHEYPTERIRFMVHDSHPALVLTTPALAGRLGEMGAPLLIVNDAALAGPQAHTPPSRHLPHHPAYVIYTSGSTGRPKGTVLSRASVANLLTYHHTNLITPVNNGHRFRFALSASWSFDTSWEGLLWLLAGHELHILDDDTRRDPTALINHVTDHHIDVLDITPTYAQQLLGAGLLTRQHCPAVLLLGGEALTDPLWTQLRQAANTTCWNLYGPTECTVDALAIRLDQSSRPTIGTPINGTTAYVLNDRLQLTPAGVPGELYLAGCHLARGYLHQPALTARRFVADPFGPPGTRMYRTGDLCRWHRDGNLGYLGRVDHQVKIRGFRIELGEIEAALGRLPGVSAAAAVVRDDPVVGRRLVGYIESDQDSAAADSASLRRAVADMLPDYMVPAAIVVMDCLPTTVNGKLDRDALPPAVFSVGANTGRTDPERLLCDLFSQVLGIAEVGLDDGFFELGGDSILSIQLVSRAREAGVALRPRDVFRHQTVAELAAVAEPVTPAVSEANDGTGEVAATPMLRWLEQLGGCSDHYSQAMVVTVPPGIKLGALTTALQAVLDHHDALRARLQRTAGSWRLIIPPPGQARAADVLRRVEDERYAEHGQAARERLRPEAGIMLQAVLVDRGPQRSGRLLLAIHHLVVDGVSWRVLLPDLATAYAQAAAGRAPQLPAVPTSLRRWANGLNEQVTARRSELPEWESLLRGGSMLPLRRPLDHEVDLAARVHRLTVELPAELTGPLLRSVPAAFHTGIDEVLLTALTLAIQERGGGIDFGGGVVVELEGHGRDGELGLSRTVGWLTSVRPVRLDAGPLDLRDAQSGGPAVGAALKRIKEQVRTMPGDGLGYGLLRFLDAEAADRLAALPAPAIEFNYLGRFSARAEDGLWAMASETELLGDGVDPRMPAGHPLEVAVLATDHADGTYLSAAFRWPDGLFDEEFVPGLAHAWLEYLHALVRHTEDPTAGGHTPSDLPLVSLSQDEIDEFEAEWSLS